MIGKYLQKTYFSFRIIGMCLQSKVHYT
jgi:hypothetical protein